MMEVIKCDNHSAYEELRLSSNILDNMKRILCDNAKYCNEDFEHDCQIIVKKIHAAIRKYNYR